MMQPPFACNGWALHPRCPAPRKWRHRSADYLGQRALEIESRIARLFRRQRARHRQEAAAEHVISGAVDRLDAEQLVAAIAERRKRLLRGIAAHHDAIVAGSQPRDLQLVVALVAPEPGLAVVRLVVAGQTR